MSFSGETKSESLFLYFMNALLAIFLNFKPKGSEIVKSFVALLTQGSDIDT